MGKDALLDSVNIMKDYGTKALVVCGKVMTKNGTIAMFTDLLKNAGLEFQVYNEIIGEPTDKMIEEGVKVYKDTNCDFCIGIGGGSPLDSAKAIAAMSVLSGKISDYMGKEIEDLKNIYLKL